ncbi:hypothetical protein G9Q86_00550 [Pseudomonas sp. CCUG 57209]|uniref:hypothetical protein n=1 Tax=Pseudomonas sivasensis TaxID=1880678 RepID=UPI0015EC865D|nr:hypothetical protein [Pseudomonas sivasensis]MBA2927044.1 hypothetical protein [Pseudomonas sivasensis]
MMNDYIIVGDDGSVTAVADDIDIFEYVKEIGGSVVKRDEYIPPPYVPTVLELALTESQWRDEQMPKAKDNVTAIEYGEEDIPGTGPQWQKYWLELRKWTDTNPDFPDSAKRPVAPS